MRERDHGQLVSLFTRLRWLLTSPERRLLDAEQRFFDAYCRGGGARHRELVLPWDFFSRPAVRKNLLGWIRTGEDLELVVLEQAWRESASLQERVAFHENLARFFALLSDPRTHRVNWQPPDGHLRTYGSDIFD